MAAYLFGSLAEGGVGGDMDIAVLFERYSFEAYEGLYEALCRLLKADNIDLISLDRAPLPLRRRILLQGILLYERTPGITTRLLEALLADWEDYLHLTAVLRTSLRARIQGGDTMSGRRVDRERVEISLSKLDEMVGELAQRREAFHSFHEFMAERDQRELCVHYLRIALECVLDICRHFVAAKGASLAEIDTTNLIELAGKRDSCRPCSLGGSGGWQGCGTPLGTSTGSSITRPSTRCSPSVWGTSRSSAAMCGPSWKPSQQPHSRRWTGSFDA